MVYKKLIETSLNQKRKENKGQEIYTIVKWKSENKMFSNSGTYFDTGKRSLDDCGLEKNILIHEPK